MLGELIGETNGKRIVRRVLGGDPLTVEVSFEDTGKYAGVATVGFGTYTSVVSAEGSLYGQGVGGGATQDGDVITWKGSGLGKLKPGGAVSYRGILYFTTSSQKLAKLNNVAGVFELEIDAEGKMHSKVWEWK
jgi:hypothetical protein